jgi:hypothetical protein
MKTYRFSGGEAALNIPEAWSSEDEEDGDVTVYYSDAPDAGVLRCRARVFHNPTQLVTQSAVDALILGMAGRLVPNSEHEPETTAEDTRMITYVQELLEADPPVIVAGWLVGIVAPPHSAPVISYTYMVPGPAATSSSTLHELELIEAAIRAAEYSLAPTFVTDTDTGAEAG